MSDLERVRRQLVRIGALVEAGDSAVATRAPKVSGWSIAQQLDHLLLSMAASFERLLSEPEALAGGINLLGRALLGFGRLPRGRAKARKSLEGRDRSAAELAQQVASVRELAARLEESPAVLARRDPVLPHPYFGGLDARQTLRMLGVHNDHHLRIVRDIQRSAARR